MAQIIAILKELPLGKSRIKIGLALRQAWLLNGMLYNSETWHNIKPEDSKEFEIVYQYLLRSLLKAHSKVPVEQLYLETACLPIPYVISARRMLYLKTILDRHDNELTKRVFSAQAKYNVPGDWYQIIKSDFELMCIPLDEQNIQN